MDVDRPSSSTPLLPGGGKGAPAIWLERLCICFIGAAATAPVYFILYCLGWLKLLQGNSVVLVLLVTFYPAGLVTLLLQMFYDYKFDTAYGRHRAMFVRFLISVSINVGLVPAILPHASNKTILYSMFIILGFANAACVGSLYEVCLQMPSQVKAVQYLSIGLQSGGVLAGVLGLATGFTTLEAELYIQANGTSLPFEAKAFAWSTCLLCLIGLASILVLHFISPNYRATIKGTTGAINRGPPEWGESLRAVCGPLALPIFTLIVTTSFTALTTGFYPFTPSAQYKDNPWQNSALVVILVYANQVFDLVGRGFTAQLSCPSANMLLYLTCARAGIVVEISISLSALPSRRLVSVFIFLIFRQFCMFCVSRE